jgi:hypothetical protein
MTQQVNSQDWARNGVYSGHIVDRCDDLETAYEQIIARCYNRKKDGSLGYWKHSSFTHHDFEVMCRLVRDGGYLLTHFLEAVGLTEWADPPKKSDDVAEATHQKALKQAREDLWGASLRMTISFGISSKSSSLNTMIARWGTSLRKASRPPDNSGGDLHKSPRDASPGAFLCQPAIDKPIFARFSEPLNFRLFQQYLPIAAIRRARREKRSPRTPSLIIPLN